MKLNSEQIIKALECCSPSGKHCTECVYFYRAVDGICAPYLMADALALINSQEQRIRELIEENERLRSCVMSEEQVKTIAETTIKLGIDTIKADTVRKMQERLKEQFRDKFGYRSDYIHELIDIIAKEMVEGAENGT